jgi:hypothetical protein
MAKGGEEKEMGQKRKKKLVVLVRYAFRTQRYYILGIPRIQAFLDE